MPFCEKDGFGVIYSAAGRKVFRLIIQIITNKIGNLLPFYIYHTEPLAFFQNKSNACTGRNDGE
jgi:hypothetical protein